MTLDTDKIDDAVLALLTLTLHHGDRAWKGSTGTRSAVCTRRGGKVKSVVFTPEGLERAIALRDALFAKQK